MASILPFRANRLAFPGGLPRINSAHPAAQSLRASIIPLGYNGVVSGAVNLGGSAGFQKGTPGGSFNPPVIDSAFGYTDYQSGNGFVSFTGPILPNGPPAGTGYTFASFSRTINPAVTPVFISAGDPTGSDQAPYQGILGGNFGVRIASLFTLGSGVAAVANAPYFYAVSVISRGSNIFDHNHVIVRLDTGQVTSVVVTGSNAGGTATFTSPTFYYSGVGTFGAAVIMGPAAVSLSPLTLQQLQQWAQDPWSFWYPQKFDLAEAIQIPPSLAAGGGSDTRGRSVIFQSRPNKLAFPGANVLPGVNPVHPATQNCYTSALPVLGASGTGAAYNLVTGASPTTVSAPATKVNPWGPAFCTSVSNSFVLWSNGTPVINVSALTFGVIFSVGSNNIGAGVCDADTGAVFGTDGSGNIIFKSAGTIANSGIVIPVNVVTPVFIAASYNQVAGNVNFVLTNLLTGAIKSASVSLSTAVMALTGRVAIGTATGIGFLNNSYGISAAMVSGTYLTAQQLLQWAQDPWSFWYPQRIDLAELLATPIVTAVGLSAPGLLQTRSVPGLGPQSRHTALLNASLPAAPAVVTVTGSTLPIMGVG